MWPVGCGEVESKDFSHSRLRIHLLQALEVILFASSKHGFDFML
ncbi:hypothetical protein TIFTF001_016581 [Ficus carica]|uniref:Uncharacterized protein n=1 Tax=Ficus carica TaxID=3494 RepID=A0AA88D7I8_FICCA|nr:hypothetical protein TIFTF001_016581 [Ficus carica]